jgi:hypothetical protein
MEAPDETFVRGLLFISVTPCAACIIINGLRGRRGMDFSGVQV